MPAVDVAGEFETIQRLFAPWPIRNGGGGWRTMWPWSRRGRAMTWS